MRHRNFQSSSTHSVYTVEFGTLKRKTQPCIEFQVNKENPNQIFISNVENLPLFLVSAASLIFLNSKTGNPTKFFSNFSLDNVPKHFNNYQHQKTLEQLFVIIKKHCTSFEQLEELIASYPIVEFLINCYGRCAILKYLMSKNTEQDNKSMIQSVHSVSIHSKRRNQSRKIEKIELMGNEKQLIQDYGIELRGNIISCLCEVLGVQLTIKVQDFDGDAMIEVYGSPENQIKIGISEDGEKYICQVTHESLVSKVEETRRSKDLVDTTISQTTNQTKTESRSVNKDQLGKCKICGSRTKFCQCDRKRVNVPKTPLNSDKKSIFDSLNFDNLNKPKRDERKKCMCNRAVCVCKK